MASCCRCSWSCSWCCWSAASCGRCTWPGSRLLLRARGRGLGMGGWYSGACFSIWDKDVNFPLTYNICICTGSFIKQARPANTSEMSADGKSLSTRFDVTEISCPLHCLVRKVGTIPVDNLSGTPKKLGTKCWQVTSPWGFLFS